MTQKRCSKCGQHKPLTDFYKDKRYKDGHASYCKDCQKASRNEWYAKNKDTWRARHCSVEKGLLTRAKQRARKAGIPFSIGLEHIQVPELCPYFGTPLKRGEGSIQPMSPTLDKIVPELGYVPGNVRVISNLANKMKNNATEAELITFAKAVLRLH